MGSNVNKIEDIEKIKRPFEITLGQVNTQVQQIAIDLLWSDPTDSDEILGIHPNTVKDPFNENNFVLYGPDQVDKFLKVNNLSMILRSNQICMEGIDRFSAGQLINICSTTDYGGVN